MRPISSSDIVISSDDRIAASSMDPPRRAKKQKKQSRSAEEPRRDPAPHSDHDAGKYDAGNPPQSRPAAASRLEPAFDPACAPASTERPRKSRIRLERVQRMERSSAAEIRDPVAPPVKTETDPLGDDRPVTSAQPRRRRGRLSTPSLPKPRLKRFLPRLTFGLSRLQKIAAGGVVLTAMLVSGAVIWHTGILHRTGLRIAEQTLSYSAEAGFQIRDITVAGRGRTSMEEIASALDSRHGGPILSVRLEDVKDRLEAIPSIQQAAIERRLPDSLHISIIERIPVAVWQRNGQHSLVDAGGHLIPGPIAGYEDLPLVVGDGAAAKATELLEMLKSEPQMAQRVKASVRVGNRRWNLILDDPYHGLEVRLPEEQPDVAWHRLAQLEREQALTSRRLSMIDLRAGDRLILKADRPADDGGPVKAKDSGA